MILIILKKRIVIIRKVTFPIKKKMSYAGKSWKALFLLALFLLTNINDYHRLTIA